MYVPSTTLPMHGIGHRQRGGRCCCCGQELDFSPSYQPPTVWLDDLDKKSWQEKLAKFHADIIAHDMQEPR